MVFKGGVKEAAKILASLDYKARLNVLKLMEEKDPQMAALIKESMVTFEDLRFLTVNMLSELLREINIDDLALGLRIASLEFKNNVLGNVSSRLKKDIEDILLGPPQSVDKINEAVARIMDVVIAKIDKGELVLKDNQDEYV